MSGRIVRKFSGFTTGEGHITRGLGRLSHDDVMNKQLGFTLYIVVPV